MQFNPHGNTNVMSGGMNKIQSSYFCSECGNLYDITNVPPEASETMPVSESFEKQTSEQQKGGKSTSSIVPLSKKIYFVCETCGNMELIKPRTLIVSKKSQDIAREYFGNENSPENIVNVPTLPHTRDYICPNKTCATHVNPELRDAVMSRVGSSFAVMYVCTLCLTSWK
jgi:DNA-directed RNA polymerase subunit RPC12/RpoP